MSCYISVFCPTAEVRVCFLPVFKVEDACCFGWLYAESTFMHFTQPVYAVCMTLKKF